MNENVKWITTPSCSTCIPSQNIKRRFSCMGCQKQEQKEEQAQQAPKKIKLRRSSLQKRDKQIQELRNRGLSLSEISSLLDLPRSTVYNADKRNRQQ